MLKSILANQAEITLYCFLGEAIYKTQVVEQALSYTITLKMSPSSTQEEADQYLEKQLTYTLGKAVHLSEKENLFPPSLKKALIAFLDQRNWLVHKAMADSRTFMNTEFDKEKFFQKIKSISKEAEILHHLIEVDLVEFCEARGRKMSKARAIINARCVVQ